MIVFTCFLELGVATFVPVAYIFKSGTLESMLDKISYDDFPALTAIFKDFQGLEFLFWNSRTFKDFKGACEPCL